jgi:hypothetical protein
VFGRERAFGVGFKLMRTTDPQLFEMFVFALLSVSEAGEETRRSKRWECVGPDLNFGRFVRYAHSTHEFKSVLLVRSQKFAHCVGPDLNRTSETSIIMRHASHASRDTKERAFRSAWDRI